MAIAYETGKTTGPNDLYIIIRNQQGVFIDPIQVFYEIFQDQDGKYVRMKSMEGALMHPDIGKYYSPLTIPKDAPLGTYLIRWSIKRSVNDLAFAIESRFAIVRRIKG